jgi:hypothetical protein
MGSFVFFAKENVTKASTFVGFATFVSLVLGLDYVWNTYFAIERGREPLVWALTFSTACFAFFGILNYCWFAQSLLQDEIDRITAVKARLEGQILSKRLSSRKGKPK